MWNCIRIAYQSIPVSSVRPSSAASLVVTLLCLATFGGAAAIATAAITQTDAQSGATLTNSAKVIQPIKSEPAHETVAGNPLWATPIKMLAATQDRPLFSPTRRPPAPPAYRLASADPPQALPPKEPERPPLLLIGTVAGETQAIAVFLDQKTKRTIRLRGGQSRYGWTLGAVYKREVVLQKQHAIVYLALSTAAAAPAAAPAQVAETRFERRQR
jgi:hypothetical protein